MNNYIVTAMTVLLLGCSGRDHGNENIVTADSLFTYKNISATSTTTLSNTLKDLDSTQKMQLMAPVIFKDASKEMLDYFIHFQVAKFVSRQEKVFDLTPVIISLTGDDYDAMFYILLNDEGKPVSALQIAGSGICGGPTEVSDTLLQACPDRNSYLDGKEITTYVKRMTFYPASEQYPTMVDSVTYTSKVLSNGTFETKQKDSTRYTKLFF